MEKNKPHKVDIVKENDKSNIKPYPKKEEIIEYLEIAKGVFKTSIFQNYERKKTIGGKKKLLELNNYYSVEREKAQQKINRIDEIIKQINEEVIN